MKRWKEKFSQIGWYLCIAWMILTVAGCAGAGSVSKKHLSTVTPVIENSTPQNADPGTKLQSPVSTADNADSDPFKDENLDFLDEENALEPETASVADPLEPFNRAMFQVNDKLYFYFLKPVATAYGEILPLPIRRGIKNFFYNLVTPVRFANCLFQMKGGAAVSEVGRFVVNTTAGGLGFWDLSSRYPGLDPPAEDLGQTFGHYHIGEGFYLVIPVLGPSTLRDFVGFAGDLFLSPITYVESSSLSYGLTGERILNDTSLHIGDYEAAKAAALTPYEAFRDGYIQYRNKKIAE
jgi:phospholipid-binding lipoprotein MlaA